MNLSKESCLAYLADLPEFANEIGTFTHMDNDEVYKQVILHIDTHKYFIEEKLPITITLKQSIASWFQNSYSPLMMAIEETHAEKLFPHMTKIELFLNISDHMYYLLEEKKRIELFNLGEGKSSDARDKLAAYVFIPFNQVVFSYISKYSTNRFRRFFAKLRLTKVHAKPKFQWK